MNWKIPFFDLVIGEEEKRAVLEVLNSNWLTTGPKIERFEKEFSYELEDDVHSIAVSSATAALHLSLIGLNIQHGDEVILPSLTFVACANVIRCIGATPVFADISGEDNWNISAADAEKKITNKTRAIMVVHYGGYSCDMDEFKKLSKKYNLKLIEDCSHAPFIKYKSKSVGTIGDAGCFSFFSNKNMTTGEGGMIVVKDMEFAERLRALRTHGINTPTYQRFKGHGFGYDVTMVGYNYRMDEIRAAIGIAQLKKIKLNNLKRLDLVNIYRSYFLESLNYIEIPFLNEVNESAFHIFPILLPENRDRNDVMTKLSDVGIQTSIHYLPIHKFSAYQDYKVDIPITDKLYKRILTLPLFPTMTEDNIKTIVKSLSNILD